MLAPVQASAARRSAASITSRRPPRPSMPTARRAIAQIFSRPGT